jgi:glutaredoxin
VTGRADGVEIHASKPPKVTLYSAAGCHLCASARRVIDAVRTELGFELEDVDITGDPELERRYRERIPVVLVGGDEAFTYFVHPDALRRRLLQSPREVADL